MGKKVINILNTYWSTKPRKLCWKKLIQKGLHILAYGTNGCASGDIEQVIVKLFFKYEKFIELMNFYKIYLMLTSSL